MSRIITNPVVNVSACIRLTEQELSALDAISGYGTDEFLKVFYDRMGEAYLRPHEAGLRTLFATIRTEVPAILARAEASRKAFNSSPSSLPTTHGAPKP